MNAVPRYPVYVISKGRADCCLTARFLSDDAVPFSLVVEPQEQEVYEQHFPGRTVALPFSNLGLGSIPARNWCWGDALAKGCVRHWILDDNIRRIKYRYCTRRLPCHAGAALAIMENYTERWQKVGIAGPAYEMFAPANKRLPILRTNSHVYSTLLIDNSLPVRWRGRYNEDTDLCLQILGRGLSIIQFNIFLIAKVRTMTMKGGNSAELYKDDGRLKMAEALRRQWPALVQIRKRYGRPQHVVDWKKFKRPLIPAAPDVIAALPPNPPLKLQAMGTIKSASLQAVFDQWHAENLPGSGAAHA